MVEFQVNEVLQCLVALILNQIDSPVFPTLGEYLLKGFSIIYHFCFIVIYKALALCFEEGYWVRLLSASGAFFVSLYFMLYVIREIFKNLIKLILFLLIKMLRLVLGGFMGSVEAILNKAYHWFKKGLNKIRVLSFIGGTVETSRDPEQEHLSYFKIISEAEFEEFEKQLLKRGFIEKDFVLREQLTEVTPPLADHKNGQITISFKQTGKSKTYPCGSNVAWIEEFLRDLDNKSFAS